MSGGSARLQQELRSSTQRRTSTATYRNPFTGATLDLPIKGGSVTVDVSAANRRMLDLTLPPMQSLFDTLAVPGGEITVSQTFRYIDNTTETVPLGVFCIDVEQMSYRPDGDLSMKCPDRWLHVVRNGFGLSRASVPANMAWQEIKRLIEGAWPNAAFPFPGWASLDQSATTKVGSLVWDDGDRDRALRGEGGLLAANNLDAYFNANGLAVLRPIPALTTASQPVWVVAAGPAGTLKDATRGRDLSAVHNVIVLSSTASDVILTPIEVANTRNPATDPLSSLGPLGRVTLEVSSSAFRTSAQMRAAGVTMLNKQLTVQQTLNVVGTPNPCLEGYDVIDVVMSAQSGSARPYERHILDAVTIPLLPDGEQDITVRATRSSADDTL